MTDEIRLRTNPMDRELVEKAMQTAAERSGLRLNSDGASGPLDITHGRALATVARGYLYDGGAGPVDPPEPGQDLYQWRTEDFKLKHGLDESDMSIQFEKLEEEVLELKGALLFGQGDVAEELADVIFVAHLLGHMAGVDVREAFDRVSDENLEKNRETDEDGLITKDKEQ